MAKKCPSCGTEVPDHVHACPNCPESFPDEDMKSHSMQPAGNPWSVTGILLVAVVASALIGIWALFFRLAEQPSSLAAVSSAGVQREAVSRSFARKEDSFPDETAVAAELPETAGAFEEQPLARPVPSSPAPEPEEKKKSVPKITEWKIRGHVYDVVTLGSLPRTRLVFSDARSNARFETLADKNGLYRVILPPLRGRGYYVHIQKDGYATSYMDSSKNDPRQALRQEREFLAHELSVSLKPPIQVIVRTENPLVKDFYLSAQQKP